MFTTKKSSLFEVKKKESASASPFVTSGLKTSAEVLSGNGAKKYSTTGNDFVDQFGKLGSYKAPRSFDDICIDCEKLWATNPLLSVVFIFYLRTITRIVTLFNGISTSVSQKGAELKHESIFRMIWLHNKAQDTFWKNIGLFVSVGSWKDVTTMLQYDLVYNGWEKKVLNWTKFGELILAGLNNDKTSELLKKYLPQIKANNSCTTVESQADNIIGKWICSLLFGSKESSSNYKKYRQLKSAGTAHEWQKLISQQKHNLIDFAKIHGRALNLLVRGKYLKNQGLEERYNEWITKPETELKYTGFVHELFAKLPNALRLLSPNEQVTINKQFDTLVEKGKTDKQTETSLIVVRDTSGSMGSTATGTNMSCYNIAKALALYFSSFLKGKFQDAWIEFHSTAKMHTWSGNNPLEKWYNDQSSFVGVTNFQSVIDLLCQIKRNGVAEEDFPTGILCISDSELNPTSLGITNVEAALTKLAQSGFSTDYVSKFVIVLWNLQSSYYGKGTGEKFETYGDVQNVYYFSGYSASVVGFLNGNVKNASELFMEAMDQEILNMIEL